MKILAFAASHREDSINLTLLETALAHLKQAHPSLTVQHEPFAACDLPLFNDAYRLEEGMPSHADALATLFQHADALMIAMPEYNWSVPAALKNLLDWLSCYRPVPVAGKPVFLMCATPSSRGGVMGLSHLKTILEGMGALPYPTMMTLGHAPASLEDPNKQQQLRSQLEDFISYAVRMQT
jgi:NAD(P)H-dependent FMN reductase